MDSRNRKNQRQDGRLEKRGLNPLFLFALFRKRTAALFLLSALLVLSCGIFRTAAIAKPARALAGETVSVKGSVRQVYPTGFIVEGETDGGQPISLIVWCQREMVPDRLQRFSGRVELSHISSTDRFDSEGYYHSRGIFLQGQWLEGSFSDPEKPLSAISTFAPFSPDTRKGSVTF